MRVYFDTNVLVSAFATRGLCADLLHAVLAEHQLVVGDAVLKELRGVLRQKIRIPPMVVSEVDTFLRSKAVIADAAPMLPIRIRDKDDLAILSEAVAGKADILVTGDSDLLELGTRAPLPIVNPRGFWELLRKGTG